MSEILFRIRRKWCELAAAGPQAGEMLLNVWQDHLAGSSCCQFWTDFRPVKNAACQFSESTHCMPSPRRFQIW